MARLKLDSKRDALSRVPLFAGFGKKALAEVAKITDEIDFPAGKVLIEEDELGRQFFILLDGNVDVRRRGRKVNTLGPGDFFGEIALLAERHTTAACTTTTPVRVAVVTRQNFKRLLRENSKVQMSVIAALVERVPVD